MATEIQGAKIVVEEIENAAGANPYSITLTAQQATTSGAAIDFTGLPAGIKRIDISIVGNQTSGSSLPCVQIGDSGGIEATGYLGAIGGSASNTAFTVGFGIDNGATSAAINHGVISLFLENAATFTWTATTNTARSDGASWTTGAGSKSLSAELTQIRLTTVGGSDTFAAGAASVKFQ